MKRIVVKGFDIALLRVFDDDFISLTDMLKAKEGNFLISDWLRNKNTLEFLGIWEKVNNPHFNYGEFALIKKESGTNSYSISIKQWIDKTNAIGLRATPGRYGGTYAHKDIAFEFGMWISAEFKIYLIKEFQRLKQDETKRLRLDWNLKRSLTKVNYAIHTDVIREKLVPPELSDEEANIIYASEADVLNKALFGLTTLEWNNINPKKENLREQANVNQLVVLANLESLNAEFIKQDLRQKERLIKLNKIARYQMTSLLNNQQIKQLK